MNDAIAARASAATDGPSAASSRRSSCSRGRAGHSGGFGTLVAQPELHPAPVGAGGLALDIVPAHQRVDGLAHRLARHLQAAGEPVDRVDAAPQQREEQHVAGAQVVEARGRQRRAHPQLDDLTRRGSSRGQGQLDGGRSRGERSTSPHYAI